MNADDTNADEVRALIEVSSDWLWRVDRRGRLTFSNGGLERVLGWTRADLAANDCLRLFHPDDLPEAKRALVEARRSGRPWEGIILRCRHADGAYRYLESRGAAAFDDSGAFLGFYGASRDVTDRELANQELEQAIQVAESANQAKTEFVATMTHEIRTPLNGIIGMTELTLDTALSGEQRVNLETIKTSADALLALLNGVLDFSKIEAGRLDLERVPFDVREVAADAFRIVATTARNKALALASSIAADVPTRVWGDPGRLRQVLVNLLGNAVKFTSSGEVKLVLEASPTGAEASRSVGFKVVDTGPGIPVDRLESVFAPFVQVDASTSRTFGGTGLGLAISSELVSLMGGKLGVESQVGVGSTFSFELAFDVATGADGREPAGTIAAAVASVRGGIVPRRVLVAEDNPVNATVIERLLERRGHAVTMAVNGAEAVALYSRGTFDIVLMDVEMPEMDGLYATRVIREFEHESGRRTPIVAMTAHATSVYRDRCFASGMDAFVTKPIRRERVLALVEGTAATAEASAPPAPRLLADPLLREAAPVLLADLPHQMARVADAVTQRELGPLLKATHRMRGAVSLYELTEVLAALSDLDGVAREGRWPEVAEMWERTTALVRAAAMTIERELALTSPTKAPDERSGPRSLPTEPGPLVS